MGNALQEAIEQLQRQATHRTQMVALRSDNGSYVCAESGGASALVANRPAIGPWETFSFVWLADDRVAILAINGRYVSEMTIFPLAGSLIAAADAIGPQETFHLIWHPDDRITLQAPSGSYVCAEGGGGGAFVANRPAIGEWEKFWMEVPPPL